MNQKIFLIIGVILLLVAAGGGAAFYFLGPQSQKTADTVPAPIQAPMATPTGIPQLTIILQPTNAGEAPTLPTGWQTYTSQEYGFEISFPEKYQALDDENNLYGWPNGVVLIYQGGQAYDIAIEAWGNEADYQNKYASRMEEVTVFQVGSRYLTILNNTQAADYPQIVETFTEI